MIIKLRSGDGKVISLPEKAALLSEVIKEMRKMGIQEEEEKDIPVPNVQSDALNLIKKWLVQHMDDEDINDIENDKDAENISKWDREYFNVSQNTLFEIIIAANYLDIKPLLHMCCKVVANHMKGRSVQELRDHFGIQNDFTPEEEEQIARENEWCSDA